MSAEAEVLRLELEGMKVALAGISWKHSPYIFNSGDAHLIWMRGWQQVRDALLAQQTAPAQADALEARLEALEEKWKARAREAVGSKKTRAEWEVLADCGADLRAAMEPAVSTGTDGQS